MDVKEAVKVAKAYAATVFEGETIRLEEVWFEDRDAEWCITVGLQRNEPPNVLGSMLGKPASSRMHYKTIRIDDRSGSVKSVRNHETMPVSPS